MHGGTCMCISGVVDVRGGATINIPGLFTGGVSEETPLDMPTRGDNHGQRVMERIIDRYKNITLPQKLFPTGD